MDAQQSQSQALLEVSDLSYSYDGERTIFSEVNFSLQAGHVMAVLGANGAGKSTMLNCISGMLTPKTGHVLVKGRDVRSYGVRELSSVLGYVPQISVPAFSYEVRDYVVMGRAPHMGLFNVPGDEEYAKVDEILERMGISHLAHKDYGSISGGERQQVQIARVLVQEAQIVLLDEPTNHLDYGNQLKIVELIRQIAQERQVAVVMTTHMPDHAILLNDQVGILGHDGRMVSGDAGQVVTEERLKELYSTDLQLVYIESLGRICCVAGKAQDLQDAQDGQDAQDRRAGQAGQAGSPPQQG